MEPRGGPFIRQDDTGCIRDGLWKDERATDSGAPQLLLVTAAVIPSPALTEMENR